uniref:Uncharacterized protein n=1 Tax=Anguilla anguilla TaxID=7936 RepID=A0A0E9USF8_ANGAN
MYNMYTFTFGIAFYSPAFPKVLSHQRRLTHSASVIAVKHMHPESRKHCFPTINPP